jgi:chromosome partitioning protein
MNLVTLARDVRKFRARPFLFMSAKIVAVANQKGGVGKTTTAVNLAACLAEAGQEVLLIDLDPQANASSALGLEAAQGRSLYGALLNGNEGDPLPELIQSTAQERLSIITAEEDLAGCEIELAGQENQLQRLGLLLTRFLAAHPRDGFILLDCPPSLGILMTNALAAADSVLIPLQCEFLAMDGLAKILRMIEKIKAATGNTQLALEGIVLTMYDARTNLSQQVVGDVRGVLGDKVFNTIIPRTVRLGEAPSFGQPIVAYDPAGIGAQSYRHLAEEFLGRQSNVR